MQNSISQIPIEDSVHLCTNFPSVSERYFTHLYYVPSLNKASASQKSIMGKEQQMPISSNVTETFKSQLKLAYNGVEVEQDLSEEGIENMTLPIDDVQMTMSGDGITAVSYFKKATVTSQTTLSGEDVCVMVHSNRLCLVTISPKHPVIVQKKDVIKVNFDVGKTNRLENKVSGKKKRGGQLLGTSSPICIVVCSDGCSYTVPAGVQGKLIEVNEKLLSSPQLVASHAQAAGYLAVIMPKLDINNKEPHSHLLSRDEYANLYNN